MKNRTVEMIDMFFAENAMLTGEKQSLQRAVKEVIKTYQNGGKLLICGNGGSASDSEHITGELMKGFLLQRTLPEADIARLTAACGEENGRALAKGLQGALPAISLVSHTSLITAFMNDVSADMCLAQQVYGYGKPGDALIAISTSGGSANVLHAAEVAKAFGLCVISLTGAGGGIISGLADIALCSPQTETYRVQEDHIRLYHLLCAAVESELFES